MTERYLRDCTCGAMSTEYEPDSGAMVDETVRDGTLHRFRDDRPCYVTEDAATIRALREQVERLTTKMFYIKNLARLAWLDERNIEALFQRIEAYAEAALSEGEPNKLRASNGTTGQAHGLSEGEPKNGGTT